jgi:hypothetical protein
MSNDIPPRPFRSLAELQNVFVKVILPRIRQQGECYFRHVKNWRKKKDLITEMIDLGWRWVLQINAKGKDPCRFVTTLVVLLARAVRAGRRVCKRSPHPF